MKTILRTQEKSLTSSNFKVSTLSISFPLHNIFMIQNCSETDIGNLPEMLLQLCQALEINMTRCPKQQVTATSPERAKERERERGGVGQGSVDKLTGAGREAAGTTGALRDDGSDQRRHSCLWAALAMRWQLTVDSYASFLFLFLFFFLSFFLFLLPYRISKARLKLKSTCNELKYCQAGGTLLNTWYLRREVVVDSIVDSYTGVQSTREV